MRYFIIFIIFILSLSSCVEKSVKKDNQTTRKLTENNDNKKKNISNDINKTQNEEKKISKTEKEINPDKDIIKIEDNTSVESKDLSENFDLSQKVNHENADLFAKKFLQDGNIDEEYKEKYFKVIELLDHTNKYDNLVKILPYLKNFTDIPENIKKIYERYTSTYDNYKIGVIVPKNSRYKKLATDIERGIKLAEKRYNSKLKIIIKETDLTPEETIKAAEELIFKDKVLMLIGTIKTSNSKLVSFISEKYHVPFISISKNDKSVRNNKYSFSYFINIDYSASFIAKYAINVLKYKKFAIFYPNSKYGHQNMIAFWKAVEENGGKITAVRSYSANKEGDYIAPSKKLVGRYYLNARADYVLEKRKLKKLKSGYALKKALETLEKDLEPKVDFDAMFIPDGAENTTILLPYLALYDINFKTGNKWEIFLATQKAKDKNYKLKFVQLLGTQTWAADSIAEGAGRYIQGAIFPVVYNTRIEDKGISKFTSLYIKTYNKKPSMHALYGYELFDILNKIISSDKFEGSNLREKLIEILLTNNFKSVGGKIKFNKYGEVEKQLFLMKFNSEKYKNYTKN